MIGMGVLADGENKLDRRADPWYLAFTPGVRAERVEVDGEVVVDGGRCTRVDAERIRARAWEEAEKLWSRL